MTCRVRGTYILTDDSIIYCFRINVRGERLCRILREVKLYSLTAYISAVCGWIYLILVPKCRGRRGAYNEYNIRGYRVGVLKEWGLTE